MDSYARYYRDCVRAATGTFRRGTRVGGFAIEPLGLHYGLTRDEAEEICADAWATLEKAGVATLPRKPYARLAATYAAAGQP